MSWLKEICYAADKLCTVICLPITKSLFFVSLVYEFIAAVFIDAIVSVGLFVLIGVAVVDA